MFIPDAYQGYISWQQHEQIERMIRNNALVYGIDHHHGPAREGPALLQGHVVCGICGKRMVALLIEDVTLIKTDKISIQVRFKGGSTTALSIPVPLNAWQGRKTPDTIVSLIDELLEQHTEVEVAKLLNERGCITGAGAAFNKESVHWVCISKGLKNHKQRLIARGLLTRLEMAKHYGVSCSTISSWHQKGVLSAQKCNAKSEKLYYPA